MESQLHRDSPEVDDRLEPTVMEPIDQAQGDRHGLTAGLPVGSREAAKYEQDRWAWSQFLGHV